LVTSWQNRLDDEPSLLLLPKRKEDEVIRRRETESAAVTLLLPLQFSEPTPQVAWQHTQRQLSRVRRESLSARTDQRRRDIREEECLLA
jgi:hypothetical protein